MKKYNPTVKLLSVHKTIITVESRKAPESRDDILLLKQLSDEPGILITKDELYRDAFYQPFSSDHIDECRYLERFGSRPFKVKIDKESIVFDVDEMKITKPLRAAAIIRY